MGQKAMAKNNRVKPDFDYSKMWYLLPHDAEDKFFGSLYGGRVLHDKSAFRKRKDNRLQSRIRITDQTNICRELSEPFVYPVRLITDTRVEPMHEHAWYAAKVELLEPINFWEIFIQLDDVFTGTINFSGQPYLPQGLKLPTILKGDLILNYTDLPSTIRLPEVIEGELIIQFCNVPPTWKLPQKTGKFILTGSSFYKNIDFLKMDVSFISIEGCKHGQDVLFPREFKGQIRLEDEILSTGFKLPVTIGNLSLSNVQFEKGASLPTNILGKLIMHDIKDFSNIVMPDSCNSFIAMECKLPMNVLSSVKNLKEIEFIECDISSEFDISDLKPEKVSFISMDVPKVLKLNPNFTGSLKFEDATISEGFELPEKLTGQLEILYTTLKGKVKLPENTGYEIFMIEGDDMT
ncbi:MAG: hypothetical protein ACOYMF_17030, partial [Bacteroidales bacterium]